MTSEICTLDLKIADRLKNGMEFGMKYRIQGFEGWNRNIIKMNGIWKNVYGLEDGLKWGIH